MRKIPFLLVLFLNIGVSSGIACLPGGTDATIQQALATTASEAVLCPGATFDLYNTIYFTAPNQKIYTEGFPVGATRALLRIAGTSLTQAINGRDRSGIQIRNIQVYGARDTLGWAPGESLIDVGGDASGAVVDHVRLWEPRQWYAKSIRGLEPALFECHSVKQRHRPSRPSYERPMG